MLIIGQQRVHREGHTIIHGFTDLKSHRDQIVQFQKPNTTYNPARAIESTKDHEKKNTSQALEIQMGNFGPSSSDQLMSWVRMELAKESTTSCIVNFPFSVAVIFETECVPHLCKPFSCIGITRS